MENAVLALDIGGTKIAAALVGDSRVLERREFATPRDASAAEWLGAIATSTGPWRDRYRAVGAAVTGLIDDGRWSALNPETLPVPADFPLEAELAERLGVPARAWNDAQAAAWGEFRFGAGHTADDETMVFLTISTGIGGGIVAGGRLLTGLAGHFGQWRLAGAVNDAPAEASISGRWIAEEAKRAGCVPNARAVFELWRNGDERAARIVRRSAQRAAALLLDIHLALDPARIVIGGGIGLASGYLDLLGAEIEALSPRLRPRLATAKLGSDAGLVGVADLVTHHRPSLTERV